MKNKFYMLALITLLSAATEKSFSQNYLSLFGDTSTSWDIVLHGYCDAICSSTITVSGDTNINANTYKVITGLPGFVREDSVQGKAWFYDAYVNTEYLVMDLALNAGDTFYVYNFLNVAVPFTVDSVYYASGKKYVRINAWTTMCSLNEQITFIEGSGTTAGFSYQRDMISTSVSSSMLCHHKNGVKVAGNILFNDTCYECPVGMEEHSPGADWVKIFPNPASDELRIETKNISPGNFNLAVFNLLGEKIISQIFLERLTTLNVSGLDSGIYFIRVSDNNSGRYQRFIKL